MRIGRLAKYAWIAAISGTIGFLIGGGEIPDHLRGVPHELATQARDTGEALREDETTVTGALDYVRNRVSDAVRRVVGFLDD